MKKEERKVKVIWYKKDRKNGNKQKKDKKVDMFSKRKSKHTHLVSVRVCER